MERQLTDDQLSELCMFMRIIDLVKANDPIVAKHPEFKQNVDELGKKVAEIMDTLSEEEQDMVLEEHRLQLQMLEEEKIIKKSTRK